MIVYNQYSLVMMHIWSWFL